MADFDGPLYTITTGTVFPSGYESTSHFVAFWTDQPSFAPVVGFEGGGSTPTTPEGDPIYGYGWGLSG